jgi:hypothetical protein
MTKMMEMNRIGIKRVMEMVMGPTRKEPKQSWKKANLSRAVEMRRIVDSVTMKKMVTQGR